MRLRDGAPRMMSPLDHTHDPEARSWVPGADTHPDFPIQNLPLGVFEHGAEGPRIGCAIGNLIFDLAAFAQAGHLQGELAQACGTPTLNALLALPTEKRRLLRHIVFAALEVRHGDPWLVTMLRRAADCVMKLPAQIGDYTDFYIGIHHAANIGSLFRPDSPLLPNYKHLPIGYHGRASTVAVSPDRIVRPRGQRQPSPGDRPVFSASRRLDYEVELGAWIAGENERGAIVPLGEAEDRVAGLSLLNDWSARDLQAWEYQPLGPFLSKNFATTVSPWLVTSEALLPFRVPSSPRTAEDPEVMPYLADAGDRAAGGYSIRIDCSLSTPRMRRNAMPASRISRAEMSDAAYWSIAQMVAHHASTGCNLRAGDLLGTGTLSGPASGQEGSLMERTRGGRQAIDLSGGEQRQFLEDGDEVILRAVAHQDGFRSIGFGECTGRIEPANGGGRA